MRIIAFSNCKVLAGEWLSWNKDKCAHLRAPRGQIWGFSRHPTRAHELGVSGGVARSCLGAVALMGQVMNIRRKRDEDGITFARRRAEQAQTYSDRHRIKRWAERAALVYAQYVGAHLVPSARLARNTPR